MPLLEIIRTKETTEEAVATAYQLALTLGKIPIIVNDAPGFLTTRLFALYCVEASRLALEGIPFEEVDRQLVQFGMPMGAFRVMDESGLDIAVHVQPVLSKTLGLEFEQYNALTELVKVAGALGKKVGKGFYVYDSQGKRIGVNADALRIFNKYTSQSNHVFDTIKNDIVDRCVLTLINEASKCLDENIVRTPEDIDLAMILGFGFPPFRGGLLKYADDIGIGNVVLRLTRLSEKYGMRFKPSNFLVRMAKNSARFFPERPRNKMVSKL